MLSARLGDILSELHLLSAALKRWQDEGRQESGFPLLEWCMENGFKTIEARFEEVLANLLNHIVARLSKFISKPLGARRRGPSDALTGQCAELLLEPFQRP